MSVRAVVDSVEKAAKPPSNLAALSQELEALKQRYPGVHFLRYLDRVPQIADSAWVAPGCTILGDVTVSADASIWSASVLRGDVNRIVIGERSNLQDGTIVHLGDEDPTIVESDVVIGHGAMIHGCHIESRCLIGINATILDGARIGSGSVIGACALVTATTTIPPRSLVLGVPGKVVRSLTDDDERRISSLAAKYTRIAHNYQHG